MSASPARVLKLEDADADVDNNVNDDNMDEDALSGYDDFDDDDDDGNDFMAAVRGTGGTSNLPPVQSMKPVPVAPPQTISPAQHQVSGAFFHQPPPTPSATAAAASSSNGQLPPWAQNNGLVMTNAEGVLQSTNASSLPPEKSFTIQIGAEQFRLSGASINSDAPSYFSRFFESELAKRANGEVPEDEPLRALYVDRDPATFKDIALHLQGYHVQPRDSTHYVRLFADAQFYVLPRLVKNLYDSDVYIRIGEVDFCVPRDLFSIEPGNTPNYFTLGFSLLFSAPGNPFPGLDVSGLLRPPAIKSASATGRSSRIFADIMDLLRGYEVQIRDEHHRAALLRDCRYYHFRGLEQKIIPHSVSWNEGRKSSEIVLRLGHLRQSGISIERFPCERRSSAAGGGSSSTVDDRTGDLYSVLYARPFVDNAESPHELIVETGPDSATIRPGNNYTVEFHNQDRQRIMSLFKVVKTRFEANLRDFFGVPNAQVFIINEDGKANARIDADAVVTIDGQEGWLPRPTRGGSTTTTSLAASAQMNVENELTSPGVLGATVGDIGDLSAASMHSNSSTVGGQPAKRRRLNDQAGQSLPLMDEDMEQGGHEEVGGEHQEAPEIGAGGENNSGGGGGGLVSLTQQQPLEWTVQRAQWRVRVQSWGGRTPAQARNVAIYLYAVQLDLVRGQRGRNRARGFLVN